MNENTELRTATWKNDLADNGWMDHTCSACGFTINTDIHVGVDYPVCPKCGAIMDANRASKNPNKTIYNRIVEFIVESDYLVKMAMYNRYMEKRHDARRIYPMSMFDYVTGKMYLSNLDIAKMVRASEDEFDPNESYFLINNNRLMSSEHLCDIIDISIADRMARRAICEFDDLGSSDIKLLLECMVGPDPMAMTWEEYLERSKEK